MKTLRTLLAMLALIVVSAPLAAQEYTASTFRGVQVREIGPALTSGRISDFAVNPDNPSEYYVAVASGNVWKTTNGGVTFEPIFDGYGSYSIGDVTLDPSNPNVVWVGTGENNAQRSVAYGDGVYKSEDGGKSFALMGLESSEHIGKILVDPRDSDVVWVAAQGPLWSAGGDRGLYKTTDGGETWEKVLDISPYTGVTDIVMDPRDPDVIIAAAWQRMRKVWTLVSGGPESALYKTEDGGETWEELTSGLPTSVDVGRYGLCLSPANPDYIYAVVEAQYDAGGFYRSTDRGESWRKVNDWTSRGNYYQELICDPVDPMRVFAMDTWTRITTDGGETIDRFPNPNRHVDDHALWIDPADTNHMIIGGDGGTYETFDNGSAWDFKENLPVTQFYKVTVDNSEPFYRVYGGTQDNWSLGGPARTLYEGGISNEDWIVTNGGDGFESAVDPDNPDIVYAQSQYGNLVRFDRQSGQAVYIQPQPTGEDEALRWNWDAPLLISPHSNTRLYFAANKLFRSDDRGASWTAISGDLSRQIDRNQLELMGRVWSMDAVGKNASTSIYGNIVALTESPLQEDLLYVGTDDGLIHMTQDAGGEWARYGEFPGIPDRTYVNMVLASQHDAGTVYAAFNNHKNGDFTPYLLKSTDMGRSWTSIAGDLPERGSVYAIAEDPVDPDLLFAGTEFGVYFTRDGGERWIEVSGLPTIAVRDLAIQEREDDLVLATFGRGFWVLDDYSPIRDATPDVLASDAHVFPVRDALLYIERERGREYQGATYFEADNPPFGAVFTYWVKDPIETIEDRRREAEEEAREAGEPVRYPTFEEMRAEDREQEPYLVFTITDEDGGEVRRLTARPGTGIQRIAWDLRAAAAAPVTDGSFDPMDDSSRGPLVAPGTYYVAMSRVVDGEPTEMTEPVAFRVLPLNNATLGAEDLEALMAFQVEASEFMAEIRTAAARLDDAGERLANIRTAVHRTPTLPASLLAEARALERRIADIMVELEGDPSVAQRQFETPPSISDRAGFVLYSSYGSTSAPSGQQREQLELAREDFRGLQPAIDGLMQDVEALAARLQQLGAPYIGGGG
ncbi:MAG: WD40/YVTN/BNR-like repeat-containing protein [Candidatus Longimicrobiales bacterium M2_2A_002]